MSAVLKWKGQQILFESLTWEGTDTQASRQITFTLAANAYRSDIGKPSIKLGDVMVFYYDGKQKFVGIVTSRDKSAEIGTWSYTARDFMHYLLKSSATYKFKKHTAEYITKKVCADLKIKTTNLAKTKYSIPKLICEDMAVYDIMIKAYRKAKGHTGKKYLPVMVGRSVSVITKGESSGVTLSQDSNITGASYTDTLDNLIDRVRIYSEKGKKLGKVDNKSHIKKYGIYQATYTKEKKVNAKKAAKAMFEGVTKEAGVDAVGNIKAVSGYSITVKDKATGLAGKFYITSDSHIFENGVHTMSLNLDWKNEMERVN
jgi:hypothetical protein